MSWKAVEDKHQKKYDRDYVSCEERDERQYIIDTIIEEFPYFNKYSVARGVDHCCSTIPAPRERKKYFECLSDTIGKV